MSSGPDALPPGSPRLLQRVGSRQDWQRFYEDPAVRHMILHAAFEELQITLLIAEIFNILRRHRVRAAATFTVVNIPMMVAEGLGRKLDPSMNLSIEAMPYLQAALGLGAAASASEGAS